MARQAPSGVIHMVLWPSEAVPDEILRILCLQWLVPIRDVTLEEGVQSSLPEVSLGNACSLTNGVLSVSPNPVARGGQHDSHPPGQDLKCGHLSRTVHRLPRVLDQNVYSGLFIHFSARFLVPEKFTDVMLT